MKKLAWSLLVVALLAPLPAASEAPPAAPVGVLFLDGEGRWRADQQGRARLPEGAWVGWEAVLRPEAVRTLSFEQRLALMSNPERLLASDHARRILAVERVLVLHPAVAGRVEAELVDVGGSTVRTLVSSQDGEEGRAELLAQAAGDLAERRLAVVGNAGSRLYHAPEAAHFPPRVEKVPYADVSMARAAGYEPCAVCFPDSNRGLSADPVDVALGKYVAAQIELEYRISQDREASERLARVGRRVLEQNRFRDLGYRFLLLDSDDLNAFAAPTGPLYMTSGLLRVVESDDELASILSHELSHSERKHARKQYEQAQRIGLLTLLATIATGQGWVMAAGDIAATIMVRGYGRGFELEADRDAVLLSHGAGYHAEDFLLTLSKFQELEKVRPHPGPSWLSTHPENEERLAQVRTLLAELEPLDRLVAELAPRDPGLAGWVRGSAEGFLRDPGDYDRFLDAYRRLSLEPEPGSAPDDRP